MSSDEGQVGIGVATADFAGRNLAPSGLELLSHGASHLKLRKPLLFSS